MFMEKIFDLKALEVMTSNLRCMHKKIRLSMKAPGFNDAARSHPVC